MLDIRYIQGFLRYVIRFGYISEIENKHIENFNGDAWMEQHIGMRKK